MAGPVEHCSDLYIYMENLTTPSKTILHKTKMYMYNVTINGQIDTIICNHNNVEDSRVVMILLSSFFCCN